MRPFRGAISLELVLFVAGTLITIVFFTTIVWPWLLSIWYGSCWADGRDDLKLLGNEITMATRPHSPPRVQRLAIGDCIAGVVFINAEDAPLIYSYIIDEECSEYDGYKSYMIALPSEYLSIQLGDDVKDEILKRHRELEGTAKETLEEKLDDLRKRLSTWDIIKLYIKNKMGRVPPSYCYEFEHGFESETAMPKGLDPLDSSTWNTGKEPYCIEIEPVTLEGKEKDFTYRLTQVQCSMGFGGGSSGGAGASGVYD